MKNLVNSIDIPTVFLDNDLCIKRFTYNITKAVNIIKSDIGRPINHIATNLKYENLVEDSKEVLRTLVYKEIELQTNDGTWYQMKILPYRTTNNVIDGVVITFSDIHKIKTASEEINKLNQEIQLAREYADNIIQTVREALIVLDPDLKVLSANRSFYRTFNATEEKTVGKFIYELDDKKWEIPELRVLLEHIIPQNNFFEDFEVEYDFADAGKKKMLLNARRMIYQGEKETKLILLAIR
jgi:two-component system CheB/CheR fusion protein